MTGWLKECLSGDLTEVNPLRAREHSDCWVESPGQPLSDGGRRRCHPALRRPRGRLPGHVRRRRVRSPPGQGCPGDGGDPGVAALPGA